MTDTTQAAGLTDLPERLEAEIVRTVSLDILHQAAASEIRRLRAALAAQAVPAVTDDMRNAVRWAPSSAYWSEKLKEFFGPDARTGIDALEKQLREAQKMAVGWTDADSDAARLALELECLLLDKDIPLPATSRWWASANDALDLHRKRLAASPAPAEAKEEPKQGGVDCIGLALELEARAKLVESQTTERAMLAAANGLRLLATPQPQAAQPVAMTDEQIDELSREMVKGNKSVNWLCRKIEAALSAQAAPKVPDEQKHAMRVALEVIALGDSKNPVVDAADTLVELGIWNADCVANARATGAIAAPSPEAKAQAVPQGWKRVPVKPTQDMVERQRQISIEGWTPEHDDEHHPGALPHAAGMYAIYGNVSHYGPGNPPDDWPWDTSWWKPSADHRRNLIKAGALILAEIERLDRAGIRSTGGEHGD